MFNWLKNKFKKKTIELDEYYVEYTALIKVLENISDDIIVYEHYGSLGTGYNKITNKKHIDSLIRVQYLGNV